MKNHTENDTFLARWLNNDLTEDELLEFQNSKDFDAFNKIAQLSQKFEVPNFEHQKVKDKIFSTIDNYSSFSEVTIKKEENNKRTKVKSLFFRTAIAASVAVLVMLVGVQLWAGKTTTVVTNYGENKTIMLPDGSKVELNSNSELSYLKKDWDNGDRNLTLKGEAYFAVQKGSTFSVTSNQGVVQVVGTKFNVKTLDYYYAVECYEGKVLVNKNKEEILLTSGAGVHYKDSQSEFVTFANTSPDWKNKDYIYKETPLGVVFSDLQNEYALSNFQLEKVNLTATFTGRLFIDDLEKALEVICKPMNLLYQIDANKEVTVSGK